MYHVAVNPLGQRVLGHIQRQVLLTAGERIGVAVSGGIDSVALLRLLLELRGELGVVLSVVHFNHNLRGAESDGDAEFAGILAREHGLEFVFDSDDVAGHARQKGISLETAARELRYGFFRYLLGSRGTSGTEAPNEVEAVNRSTESTPPNPNLDKIVTGHTLDDQGETVLMRIIRGTGLSGLSGIHPRIAVENEDGELCGEIVRPLLEIRRCDLEGYLREIGQSWREDSSNASHDFTRNRLRSLVVPLLEKQFNPGVVENLSELAQIAREEDEYWDNEVAGWMGTAVHWVEPEWLHQATRNSKLVQIAASNKEASVATELQSRVEQVPWLVMNASVSRAWLLSEPLAVQRRVVKAVGDSAGIPLEFKHVEGVLRFAEDEGESGKELSLPRGWKVLQRPEELLFVTPDLRGEAVPRDYEYELSIPGEVVIHESGAMFQALRIPAEETSAYNPEELLRADSLPGHLKVRNWRAGDRFWPAHTKSPKKIKELFQERHIAAPERALWPVVLSGDEIVWVRGFPVHAKFRAEPGVAAVLITARQQDEF